MFINFNMNWKYSLNGEFVKEVTVPHDAMIDGKRSKASKGGAACAYFDGGIYTYEKQFDVPAEWKDKNVTFEFEGVYRKVKVYINDKFAKEWAYGYTGFYVNADEFLIYGKQNTIKVVADNSEQPNSRWYTGGGIYRPVNLIVKNKTHFENDGITVSTVSIDPAEIRIKAKHNGGTVQYEVLDGEHKVATASGSDVKIQLPLAKLWDEFTPNLYTLKATLSENGEIVDEEEIRFGIRSISWSNKGLFINGQETLLRGGCVHHDNGILGARAYEEAEERKVRKIKEAGYNAIRSSHNPCSKAFVRACDKYGVYLMDETFDMWYMHKKKFDYASDFDEWYEKDVAAMVAKDKNHPSVIMYSIANEVSEPYEQKGVETAKKLVSLLHSLDNTRPVTAGINLMIINNAANGKGQYTAEKVEADASPKVEEEKPTSSLLFNMIATRVGPAMNNMANGDDCDKLTSPTLDSLDIAGYNYASGRYPLEGEKHPDRIIFGSETFPQDIYQNWEMVKKYPYLIGDFMWTSWDYLGEVGAGGWTYDKQFGLGFEKPYPWIIADTGAIDINGVVGAEAVFAAVVWEKETKPRIFVKPVNHAKETVIKSVWRGTNAIESWSWKGCEGYKAEVEVYSNANYIQLLVNGKKVGVKPVKECKAVFKTKYKPGTITAVALDKNKRELSRGELKSATGDLKIALQPENGIKGKNNLAFINVSICGENGVVESNADRKLSIKVENGELLAFGSAQQKTEEPYSSNVCETYYGRALAIVKCTGKTGISVSDGDITASTDL